MSTSAIAPITEDKETRAASAASGILAATSALGVATVLERGFGFLANFLAARIGGAGIFGAYSLALTTANNIASYAGGGIGSTATRFSGEYNERNNGYGTVARALTVVSIVSAALATILLAMGAGPLARVLLRNPGLTNLLRWSALSAGAMVMLECCRGFLIGQRQFSRLLLLSGVAGTGLLIGLPPAARHSPSAMVMAQSIAVSLAVAVCGVLIWRRLPAAAARQHETTQLVKQVWHFGLIQLAGIVGLNAAGWWVASLVARADTTLVAMGVFAVASQLRNMAALGPGLLTQSSWGMLAEKSKDGAAPHEAVMALCSFGSSFSSVAIAGLMIAILPWALPALFGATFRTGVLPASLALATAIVHMSAGPAAARLTVVSLRATGIINAVWAVLVAALATFLIPAGGAVAATGIYLGMHLVSAILVIGTLRSFETLPRGLTALNILFMTTAAALGALAVLRQAHPSIALPVSVSILLVTILSLAVQTLSGRACGWIPSRPVSALRAAIQKKRNR